MTDHERGATRLGSAGLTLLGRRSHGPAVSVLRKQLRATGDLPAVDEEPQESAPAAVGEVFDDVLDRAVRAFQQGRGLIVDGLVGPQTATALEDARWHLGDRLLQFTPGHLLRGDDVAHLQERLLTLGFSPGRVDSLFGPDTDHAVRAFQQQDLTAGLGQGARGGEADDAGADDDAFDVVHGWRSVEDRCTIPARAASMGAAWPSCAQTPAVVRGRRINLDDPT